MRAFLLVLSVLPAIFQSVAHAEGSIAGKFTVTAYSWCNGPVSDGDASHCPSYDSWNGVDLKLLKSIEIFVTGEKQSFMLADTQGVIWQQNLNECNYRYSDPMGCHHSVEFSEPHKVKLHISQWRMGDTTQRLTLIIDTQSREVSMMGPGQSAYIFSIREQPNLPSIAPDISAACPDISGVFRGSSRSSDKTALKFEQMGCAALKKSLGIISSDGTPTFSVTQNFSLDGTPLCSHPNTCESATTTSAAVIFKLSYPSSVYIEGHGRCTHRGYSLSKAADGGLNAVFQLESCPDHFQGPGAKTFPKF